MTYEDHLYHAERERQCRALAACSTDPEIQRLHAELAELHAERAAAYTPAPVAQIKAFSAVQ
ncbi:hypothetical protein G7077_09415 [Sphingomonas piscis]|uniref:Uncharacterized protein n=1 Tax=Sphingomonas piscis TaxID=2714943 RepID=A0A6G7YQR6_9SPHN|nr:hypothetical protein [Sphingomonas piscis]QIK79079.1 hypothetical protein G7077_09415 [Sphingomonas piscis]